MVMYDHIQCRQVDGELSLERARPPFRPRIVDFLKHWWLKRSASISNFNITENAHLFPEDSEQVNILVFMHLTVQVGLSSVVSRIIYLRAWNQLDLHRGSPGYIMSSLCVSIEGPADEENRVSFNWGKATVDVIAAWQYGQVQTYPLH
ncbi:hypothetical protein BDR06DRAFT_1012683 [Suillus hirtellus]|nr:hypothetical protein BDR06DRAFT_1012683 [Suillus hirtellus]